MNASNYEFKRKQHLPDFRHNESKGSGILQSWHTPTAASLRTLLVSSPSHEENAAIDSISSPLGVWQMRTSASELEETKIATPIFKQSIESEAKVFIQKNSLGEAFDLAIELITKHIPNPIEIRGVLKNDTVISNWIELYVIVNADLKTLTQGENDLLDEWVEGTSVVEGQQIRIDYKFSK